jgi:membrane-bound lytic murein transglycosylase B
MPSPKAKERRDASPGKTDKDFVNRVMKVELYMALMSLTVPVRRKVERAMLLTTVFLTVGLTLGACAATSVAVDTVVAARAVGPSGENMSFPDWVRSYRGYAMANGISAATFDQAFANVRYNPQVTSSNQNQPEHGRAFWDYVSRAVSDTRIANGRQKQDDNRTALTRVEQTYGVPTSVVTAVWGMESGFGANTGSINMIEALATLAYRGNRTEFGARQLLAALKILEAKDIPPQRMLGSWAGAMGHTQFIPTTFLDFAVDGDGDGHRDLWNSLPDVFSSTANYLSKSGWKRGEPCYVEVKLPAGFNYANADLDTENPASAWSAQGVRRIGGEPLIGGSVTADEDMAIIIPTGHKGPAFAVTKNFKAVMKYNPAQTYALSVCLLANRIEGRQGVVAVWPTDDMPVLVREDRIELQRLLARFDATIGEPDGVIGRNTRRVVRNFQAANGLVPDGYATQSLLRLLRSR